MPRYRLHADHYLGGAIRKAGEVVEYDGNPGSQMEPLCDEGWKRHHGWQEKRRSLGLQPSVRFPFRVIEARVTGSAVRPPMDMAIPEGWRDLKGLQLTNLAKKLGAPFGINAQNARQFIEELEEAQTRAIAPPQPVGDDPNQALAAAGV